MLESEMNELVSVCTITYNHEKFIEYTIKSIWEQDYKNIEILVLDDGSDDKTLSILNDLKSKSPYPMTVITQKNTGNLSQNNNKLINIAKGKYICILDGDDMFLPDTISKKIELMVNNQNLQFVANSKVRIIDVNNNIKKSDTNENLVNIASAEDLLNLEYKHLHSYFVQGVLIRKTLLQAVNGYDEDMLADDIVLRTKIAKYMIVHKEYSFKILDSEGVCYRKHESNISLNYCRQLKSVADYLNRYWKDYPNPDKLNEWYRHAVCFSPYKTLYLTIVHPRFKNYIKNWFYIRFKFHKSNLRNFLIKCNLYKPKD